MQLKQNIIIAYEIFSRYFNNLICLYCNDNIKANYLTSETTYLYNITLLYDIFLRPYKWIFMHENIAAFTF